MTPTPHLLTFPGFVIVPVGWAGLLVSAAVTIRYWGFPERKAWHICPLESEQTLAACGGPLPRDSSHGGTTACFCVVPGEEPWPGL